MTKRGLDFYIIIMYIIEVIYCVAMATEFSRVLSRSQDAKMKNKIRRMNFVNERNKTLYICNSFY